MVSIKKNILFNYFFYIKFTLGSSARTIHGNHLTLFPSMEGRFMCVKVIQTEGPHRQLSHRCVFSKHTRVVYWGNTGKMLPVELGQYWLFQDWPSSTRSIFSSIDPVDDSGIKALTMCHSVGFGFPPNFMSTRSTRISPTAVGASFQYGLRKICKKNIFSLQEVLKNVTLNLIHTLIFDKFFNATKQNQPTQVKSQFLAMFRDLWLLKIVFTA